MSTIHQKLLYCFLILNVTLVMVNVAGAGDNFLGHKNSMPLRTLALVNTTTNLRGSGNKEPINPTAEALHPFDKLSKRLDQFDWDYLRIDELTRTYWDTNKSFLEHEFDRKTKTPYTTLSTSCLHTAAWIITGLLDLQKRPDNLYIGLYRVPKNKDLIVYDNTHKANRSTVPGPAIQGLRDFIESRPLNESVYVSVDMYVLKDKPSHYYIDHHFAIHAFNGSISLYHSWQDKFTILQWMSEPGMHKLRYPMPIDTFMADLEKALTYTEDPNEILERDQAAWRIFGITETLEYGKNGWPVDKNCRSLRSPWVVSLITHWPNPSE